MKTIFRYPIAQETAVIAMPEGAVITSILQGKTGFNIYALVDPKAKTEARRFGIFGTGCPLKDAIMDKATFLASIQVQVNPSQATAFHLFELFTEETITA